MANCRYSNETKKMVTELILIGHESTSLTAKKFDIPLKTLEKWITSYNKNPRVFDSDYMSPEQHIKKLKQRISELETTNEILKKTLGFYIKTNK